MRCELCGKEVPHLKTAIIEGAVLKVCEDCAKFGEEIDEREVRKYVKGRPAITEKLESRERRMKEKDILEEEEVLAPDYSGRVKEGRIRLGLNKEELAKKINEKRSVIAKVESGELVPDKELTRKLEKFLNIDLMIKPEPLHVQKKTGERRGLTLGDLIRIEK